MSGRTIADWVEDGHRAERIAVVQWLRRYGNALHNGNDLAEMLKAGFHLRSGGPDDDGDGEPFFWTARPRQ